MVAVHGLLTCITRLWVPRRRVSHVEGLGLYLIYCSFLIKLFLGAEGFLGSLNRE